MMRRFLAKLLLLSFFTFSSFSYANSVKITHIEAGYTRASYNDEIICLVRSQSPSVLVLNKNGKTISNITVGLSYPVSAIYKAGMVFISDYYKSSVMVYTMFGRFVKRIDVGSHPTTIKSFDGKIYVSCSKDSSVYEIDYQTLLVRKKYSFKSASPYFEVLDDKLVYLYFFDSDKSYEIVSENRVEVKVDNLKNPVKYIEKNGVSFLLGYTDGMLVCLKNNREMWRINLPDFARDMVLTENYIVVTSLLEPIASLITYTGEIAQKIILPNVSHRVLNMKEKLVFLNHLPGEVYIVDPEENSIETINVGTYALEMFKISESEVVVLCSDSGELYFINLGE
ncbi:MULTISPECIES: YncE family protein [Pseudothermotoga]|uniref:Uncharacterized protein n=2 Tax=Thermotogaceae TaxID=188709 RepID=A8F856_PSELT|nr:MULTISPECIES: hypothetical protein [Pseudothermotoga]KUK21193.1 MAG: Uncharacterized protein XD56_0879 [Pseudothermotoga lettingae]MDI3494912.1 hypothetical protein [Pseudothermotoga sp.]ABV34340.1 hypothetical protein Tlet_1786 [Pseudothermotoga lettingae TMO]MDK2885041.1 hypothetical protein [Pseudothermotoga sp.]GLI48715.1 hypothetical protein PLETTINGATMO_08840 [Pseudothermotoga lettingae TMO]